MAKLKSELSWSFSRSFLFKECCRSYFYNYYASWGGWSRDADELSRKAYILKNMRNADAWVGDIVHQIIKWILENQKVQKEIPFKSAADKAKEILLRTWEQSRAKMWMDNVKQNLNLFEHYYNREFTREQLAVKLQKVLTSIRNIYDSGLLESFSRLPKESFLSIDDLDSFQFEGVKIYAVPDFAVKKDKYTLYDWKTGKPSPKDALQLSCYALYAVNKWDAKVEEINIIPVYLAQEQLSLNHLEIIELEKVKQYIRETTRQMRAVLSDIAANKADINRCGKTEDTWRCERCKFQEICQ